MADYYDRKGNEISQEEWANLFENNTRKVARDEDDTYVVSTVFLGLNHNFSDGPPHIFETMVFRKTSSGGVDWADLDMQRYTTEDEARAGHTLFVEKYLTKPL